ncbi:hypothetical protein [Campylobacter sp.]|uniref:hypothetical protein n=1 Tax=Campylobacter sp. TaxID=205 RepID=UPI002A5075C2|nr:hypothetical protein [Campylobacter sp.]MDD7090921.1 hypothetical protein [Campylobacteraceae bacterium]MCI6564701.1 hypothetical protein [Campylobacter sp.]MDY3245860.1 hypothetical protein [Campylobacter sp.]MDY4013647.1 hypothetical protein [Campylobacter sp.]MDY5285433.1 hypothetical protein [Campylobacter sp.]
MKQKTHLINQKSLIFELLSFTTRSKRARSIIGANLLPGIFRYFVAQKTDLCMFALAHTKSI